MNTFLDTPLTKNEQQAILKDLFNYELIDEFDDGDYELYNNEGLPFYLLEKNEKYHFTTIRNIIKYVHDRGENIGVIKTQNNFKKLLGL